MNIKNFALLYHIYNYLYLNLFKIKPKSSVTNESWKTWWNLSFKKLSNIIICFYKFVEIFKLKKLFQFMKNIPQNKYNNKYYYRIKFNNI